MRSTDKNKIPGACRFFSSGAEFYPFFKDLIRSARREILISVYAFHNDRIGREFAALLTEKARQGVRVRVLFDSVGSWFDQRDLVRRLRDGGVEARLFRDMRRYFVRQPFSFLYRNHARLFLVDGKHLAAGGMGIGEIYLRRRDCFLVVPVASPEPLVALFDGFWKLAARSFPLPAFLLASLGRVAEYPVAISGPFPGERQVYAWLFARIQSARSRIVIATTWFFPPRELLAALQAAAARGVKISLVTPLATDRQGYDGFRALPMAELLRSISWYGIETYFHQKYVMIDKAWCLGSANFDMLSFVRNYELNLSGEGGEVLKHLERDSRELIGKARPRTEHPTPRFFRYLGARSYRFLELCFTASPNRLSRLFRRPAGVTITP